MNRELARTNIFLRFLFYTFWAKKTFLRPFSPIKWTRKMICIWFGLRCDCLEGTSSRIYEIILENWYWAFWEIKAFQSHTLISRAASGLKRGVLQYWRKRVNILLRNPVKDKGSNSHNQENIIREKQIVELRTIMAFWEQNSNFLKQ